MPISSAPTLLAPYLLQLIGLSTKQLEDLKAQHRLQRKFGIASMDLDQPWGGQPQTSKALQGAQLPPSKTLQALSLSAKPFVPSASAAAFTPGIPTPAPTSTLAPLAEVDHHMGVDDGYGVDDYGYSKPSESTTSGSYSSYGANVPSKAGGSKETLISGGIGSKIAGEPPLSRRVGATTHSVDLGNGSQVPLPVILSSLTADLGSVVEAALRQEFEELFDSVVSQWGFSQ